MTVEQFDRNVYLLGAGFSAPSGAPVVRYFLDKSREFYSDLASDMDEDERERFRNVFDFKRSMAAAREKFLIDLDDVEKLFGLIEMSDRLGRPGAAETRANMIYVIAKTLQLATSPGIRRPKIGFDAAVTPSLDRLATSGPLKNTSGNEFTADIYDYFAALVGGLLDHKDKRPTRKDTVITFNYDLVCDDAIRRVGLSPNYNLPEDPVSRPDIDGTIDVLKLHGSTNWAICRKCIRNINVLDRKWTNDPKRLRELRCPQCNDTSYELLLVPPSWDKNDYQKIMRIIWSKAVEELAKASRVCVIGYSMPEMDAFFRYLLTLALSENHRINKIIVVDSNPEIEAKYRGILDPLFQQRRFSFPGGSGLASFLGNISVKDSLGRGEILQRYVNTLPVQ